MKIKKVIFTLLLFLAINSIYSQETLFEERVSVKKMVGNNCSKINLQDYIESFYKNSSRYYNSALPSLDKGEYQILIKRKNEEKIKVSKTKNLDSIHRKDILEIKYEKSKYVEALYGRFYAKFGIVTIVLKDKN